MSAARIPILQLGDHLIASIQVDLHEGLIRRFTDDLSTTVVQTRATGVLIDISAIDLVDPFMSRMLSDLADALAVLGARTVVVGMQPAVAITLVELGLALDGMLTALDVESGMALLTDGNTAGGGDHLRASR